MLGNNVDVTSGFWLLTRHMSCHANATGVLEGFTMGDAKRRREFYAQRPEERIGDAPVEAQYHEKMTVMMRVLDEFLNDGKKGADRTAGFVLMVFPFGNRDGRCNYMSNGADRRDIVALMREMIARFEGQPEMSGQA